MTSHYDSLCIVKYEILHAYDFSKFQECIKCKPKQRTVNHPVNSVRNSMHNILSQNKFKKNDRLRCSENKFCRVVTQRISVIPNCSKLEIDSSQAKIQK